MIARRRVPFEGEGKHGREKCILHAHIPIMDVLSARLKERMFALARPGEDTITIYIYIYILHDHSSTSGSLSIKQAMILR
jgi:hypothetical protein